MDGRVQEGRGEDRDETADHDDDRTLVRSLRPEDEQGQDRKEESVPGARGDAIVTCSARSSWVRASRRSIHSIPSPQDPSSRAIVARSSRPAINTAVPRAAPAMLTAHVARLPILSRSVGLPKRASPRRSRRSFRMILAKNRTKRPPTSGASDLPTGRRSTAADRSADPPSAQNVPCPSARLPP